MVQLVRGNHVHWTPPPKDCYKINVVASIEHNVIGIGVVIRDFAGRFLAGRAIKLDGCADPHRAELLAEREGLIFVWDAGLRHVILERDASNVCDCIEGVAEDLSYNGSIIKDIVMFAS